MPSITEIDKMGDMEIGNKGHLRNEMQPARRRCLPALTIPQSER